MFFRASMLQSSLCCSPHPKRSLETIAPASACRSAQKIQMQPCRKHRQRRTWWVELPERAMKHFMSHSTTSFVLDLPGQDIGSSASKGGMFRLKGSSYPWDAVRLVACYRLAISCCKHRSSSRISSSSIRTECAASERSETRLASKPALPARCAIKFYEKLGFMTQPVCHQVGVFQEIPNSGIYRNMLLIRPITRRVPSPRFATLALKCSFIFPYSSNIVLPQLCFCSQRFRQSIEIPAAWTRNN